MVDIDRNHGEVTMYPDDNENVDVLYCIKENVPTVIDLADAISLIVSVEPVLECLCTLGSMLLSYIDLKVGVVAQASTITAKATPHQATVTTHVREE